MYFSNILAVAALAVIPAIATPRAESLVIRDGECYGGMMWNGWKHGCTCQNKNCFYDDDLNECRYPATAKPDCQEGETAYCATSESDYCEYDEKDQRCYDNHKSQVFCCAKDDFSSKVKEVCSGEKSSCAGDQFWDYGSGKCVCEKGKIWRNDKCCHGALAQPHCGAGSKSYCAKDKHNYCEYDDKNDWCEDNGQNVSFCSKPEEAGDYCNKHWS